MGTGYMKRQKEYTVSDWYDRLDRHKREREFRSKEKSAWEKEHDPQRKNYFLAGLVRQKIIREKNLNRRLDEFI